MLALHRGRHTEMGFIWSGPSGSVPQVASVMRYASIIDGERVVVTSWLYCLSSGFLLRLLDWTQLKVIIISWLFLMIWIEAAQRQQNKPFSINQFLLLDESLICVLLQWLAKV